MEQIEAKIQNEIETASHCATSGGEPDAREGSGTTAPVHTWTLHRLPDQSDPSGFRYEVRGCGMDD